jgi:phosphate-selective porin OprO and OprP
VPSYAFSRALPAVLGVALSAQQADEPSAAARRPREPFPELGLLLRDDRAPVLNELWLLGRYHGQNWWTSGDERDDEGYESRRFRLGFQARLFQDLIVHAQMVSGTDLEPFYNGFTELWVGWRFDDALVLTIGQQKHRFTHDRDVSSRYLNYLERALLTNMFAADYTPAVTLSGRGGPWSYYAGVFSNATSSRMEESFTELNSGSSLLGAVALDLGTALGTDTAVIDASAVHSEADDDATNLNFFEQGLAAALIVTDGSWSLMTELTAGLDARSGSALGLNLQPGVFLTDRLQLVGRYQLAGSDGDDGLRAQRRYEREVGLSTGDRYQAFYLGTNYLLAGHRLKVMSGVEYSTLGGEDCWTFSVAFRLFWGPHSRGPYPMIDTLPGLWGS